MDTLKNVYADKLVDDDREPVTTFSIPGWEHYGQYALYAPKSEFWNQLLVVGCVLLVFVLFDIKYSYFLFIERQQAFKYIYYIYSNRTSVTVTFFFFFLLFFFLSLFFFTRVLSSNLDFN